jgi:transposase
MTKLTSFTGIDVSKDVFDVCVLNGQEGRTQSKQFSNNEAGFAALSQWLPSEAHCVMEATGPYYLRLAFYLHEKGVWVSVVNPLVIKHFSKMKMCRAKTDRKDAALLALFAKEQAPLRWTPPKSYVVTLQQLGSVLVQLTKQHTALTNQLKAFECSGMLEKDTKTLLQRLLRQVEKQSCEVEKKMERLISCYHQELLKRLTTIPGLGQKTALVLIVVSGGFTRFSTYKQLCSYLGLSPRIHDSGKLKGKTPICKMGMSRLRALLYMCSWSALKYNQACKALYERLIEKGKAGKVALIAVCCKLIKQAFAIVKHNSSYQADYQKNICF